MIARPRTRTLIIALVVCLCAIATTLLALRGGQPATESGDPLVRAQRAFDRGRFDEADTLAKSREPQEELATVIRARVAIARGRYADAEALLTPVATRLPRGEAALELGLLRLMLGRKREAVPMLTTLADAPSADSDLAAKLRSARAARALGQFRDANGY